MDAIPVPGEHFDPAFLDRKYTLVYVGTQCRVNGEYVGRVVKLADTQDLGSCAARLGGSSPPSPISRAENKDFREEDLLRDGELRRSSTYEVDHEQ